MAWKFMRTALKEKELERGVFTGIFSKYGLKSNFRGPSTETILLIQVKDGEGRFITDHLWFNLTKGFADLGTLRKGDQLQFEARVKQYKKGYINRQAGIDQSEADYKLSHPTKIKKL